VPHVPFHRNPLLIIKIIRETKLQWYLLKQIHEAILHRNLSRYLTTDE
jgi:hypothetical protein